MKSRAIFIVYCDLGVGGVQRKITDICLELRRSQKTEKETVYLILDHHKTDDLEEDLFLEQVYKAGIKVLFKPQVKLWRFKFPLAVFLFWQFIKYSPKVVVSFWRKSSIISVLFKSVFFWRKFRVIVGFDNVPSLALKAYIKSIFKRNCWKKLIKIFYPRADFIVVPSETAKQDMVDNFKAPKEKILVNKNWVLNFSQKKKKLDYDLIYIGRIDWQKNIGYMVEVVEKLKLNNKKIKAGIVGWGKEVEKIKYLITQKQLQENIFLLGSQKNISDYLRASKIFLLSSRFEGLPISALEAMAHGLPVITTSYPGVKELIQSGKTGFICKNRHEYVKRVTELLQNERKRLTMGKRAQDYVKKYHGNKNLKDMISLIRD